MIGLLYNGVAGLANSLTNVPYHLGNSDPSKIISESMSLPNYDPKSLANKFGFANVEDMEQYIDDLSHEDDKNALVSEEVCASNNNDSIDDSEEYFDAQQDEVLDGKDSKDSIDDSEKYFDAQENEVLKDSQKHIKDSSQEDDKNVSVSEEVYASNNNDSIDASKNSNGIVNSVWNIGANVFTAFSNAFDYAVSYPARLIGANAASTDSVPYQALLPIGKCNSQNEKCFLTIDGKFVNLLQPYECKFEIDGTQYEAICTALNGFIVHASVPDYLNVNGNGSVQGSLVSEIRLYPYSGLCTVQNVNNIYANGYACFADLSEFDLQNSYEVAGFNATVRFDTTKIETKIADLQKEQNEVKKQITDLYAQYNAIAAQYNATKIEIENLSKEHDATNIEIADLYAKYNAIEARYNATTIEIANLSKKHDAINIEIANLYAKYNAIEAQYNATQAQITKLEAAQAEFIKRGDLKDMIFKQEGGKCFVYLHGEILYSFNATNVYVTTENGTETYHLCPGSSWALNTNTNDTNSRDRSSFEFLEKRMGAVLAAMIFATTMYYLDKYFKANNPQNKPVGQKLTMSDLFNDGNVRRALSSTSDLRYAERKSDSSSLSLKGNAESENSSSSRKDRPNSCDITKN